MLMRVRADTVGIRAVHSMVAMHAWPCRCPLRLPSALLCVPCLPLASALPNPP